MKSSLKTALFASLSLIIATGLFLQNVQAATTPLQATVRIEIYDANNTLLSFGSGTIIDPDGHILTSQKAVERLDLNRGLIARICLSKDETSTPTCNMRATLIAANATTDLALLQINSIQSGNFWTSIEEQILKTGYKFPFISWNQNASASEDIHLGDALKLLSYPAIGNASLGQVNVEVSGFARTLKQGKTAPNLVRVDKKFATNQAGGGIFSASSTLVGVMTFAKDPSGMLGSFTSLPVINTFLRDSLGASYFSKDHQFVLLSSLTGTYNGLLPTNHCPAYATVEAGSNVCRCNAGFFAVGNTCIVGNAYCSVTFPNKGRYDDYLHTCLCRGADGVEATCVKTPPPVVKPTPTPTSTKPVPPPGPKPPVATTTTKPVVAPAPTPVATHGPQFFCPVHATYNAKTWSCVCDASWSKNTAGTACAFNAAPLSANDLNGCEVIGNKLTRRYYGKNNAAMKSVVLKDTLCFATEAGAKKARYRKG